MLKFFRNPIVKKLIMAFTGASLLSFVIIHLLGNTTIYFGFINTYAENLHKFPVIVWLFRIVIAVLLSIHIFLGILLKLENYFAKPKKYKIKKKINTTFSSEYMIWTGLIIGAFLVYHLQHFTIQTIDPAASAQMNKDIFGKPDISAMIFTGFKKTGISLLYTAGILALLFHLMHGIQSIIQTIGLNNEKTLPVFQKASVLAAVIIFCGYVSIPVIIFIGILGR
ncbi:MAG: succinate dehydrogenase cytochrome b subunit [Nitrospiraceae bacterium]|nr:succinate dehydrogenase cytochrome b subunit [Nitrospiraceae bacterium]